MNVADPAFDVIEAKQIVLLDRACLPCFAHFGSSANNCAPFRVPCQHCSHSFSPLARPLSIVSLHISPPYAAHIGSPTSLPPLAPAVVHSI